MDYEDQIHVDCKKPEAANASKYLSNYRFGKSFVARLDGAEIHVRVDLKSCMEIIYVSCRSIRVYQGTYTGYHIPEDYFRSGVVAKLP